MIVTYSRVCIVQAPASRFGGGSAQRALGATPNPTKVRKVHPLCAWCWSVDPDHPVDTCQSAANLRLVQCYRVNISAIADLLGYAGKYACRSEQGFSVVAFVKTQRL
jgi:hypothetical protein